MKIKFKSQLLAACVFQKRISDKQSIREASKVAGVSAATLSRVENEKTPDLLTYKKICNWLGAEMEKFF